MRQTLKFNLTSAAPLLLHNGQLVDPLNKFSKMLKQVSGKRAKTDADFAEMARIEWYGSLYLHLGRVCLPSEVLEAAIVSGAKKMKLGKQAQSTIFCPDHILLEFDGCDLTPDQLWERDQNRFTAGVRIGTNRIMRTRFRVDSWTAIAEVTFDDKVLNASQVVDILRITGEQVGTGDWRPKFGRFDAIASKRGIILELLGITGGAAGQGRAWFGLAGIGRAWAGVNLPPQLN